MTMISDKIQKMSQLKTELNDFKNEFKIEMGQYIKEELNKRGFIDDPRGYYNGVSFYNPDTKMTFHICHIGELSVSITIYKMINDGMNFHSQNYNFGPLNFNFHKKTFDQFFNTDFSKRIKKMDKHFQTIQESSIII